VFETFPSLYGMVCYKTFAYHEDTVNMSSMRLGRDRVLKEIPDI
jgi:hypothetical protein